MTYWFILVLLFALELIYYVRFMKKYYHLHAEWLASKNNIAVR